MFLSLRCLLAHWHFAFNCCEKISWPKATWGGKGLCDLHFHIITWAGTESDHGGTCQLMQAILHLWILLPRWLQRVSSWQKLTTHFPSYCCWFFRTTGVIFSWALVILAFCLLPLGFYFPVSVFFTAASVVMHCFSCVHLEGLYKGQICTLVVSYFLWGLKIHSCMLWASAFLSRKVLLFWSVFQSGNILVTWLFSVVASGILFFFYTL